MLDPKILEQILKQSCSDCNAQPGTECSRRDGKPFHAGRMDKGYAAHRKEKLRIFKELEELVG